MRPSGPTSYIAAERRRKNEKARQPTRGLPPAVYNRLVRARARRAYERDEHLEAGRIEAAALADAEVRRLDERIGW